VVFSRRPARWTCCVSHFAKTASSVSHIPWNKSTGRNRSAEHHRSRPRHSCWQEESRSRSSPMGRQGRRTHCRDSHRAVIWGLRAKPSTEEARTTTWMRNSCRETGTRTLLSGATGGFRCRTVRPEARDRVAPPAGHERGCGAAQPHIQVGVLYATARDPSFVHPVRLNLGSVGVRSEAARCGRSSERGSGPTSWRGAAGLLGKAERSNPTSALA